MKRMIFGLLLFGAALLAEEPRQATDSVVGVRARINMQFNMRGRTMNRAVGVQQVGVVIGDGLILTEAMGDDPENIRIFIAGSTEGIDAELVESDGTFSILRAEELKAKPIQFDRTWSAKTGRSVRWVGLLAGSTGKWSPVIKSASIDAVLKNSQTDETVYYSDPPFRGPVVTRCALLLSGDTAVGVVITKRDTNRQGGGGRRGGGDMFAGTPIVKLASSFAHYLDGNVGKRGILGVNVETLGEKVAEAMGLKGIRGVMITQVTPGSAAEAAKIQVQDVIVKIDGTEVVDDTGLRRALQGKPEGTTVKVELLRIGDDGAKPVTVEATLKAKEDSDAEDRFRAKRFGFTAEPLTAAVRARHDMKGYETGVHVRRLKAGSPAALGRPTPLRRGDVVLKVGEIEIEDIKGLKAALKEVPNGTPVALFVRNGRDTRFVEVTPEEG